MVLYYLRLLHFYIVPMLVGDMFLNMLSVVFMVTWGSEMWGLNNVGVKLWWYFTWMKYVKVFFTLVSWYLQFCVGNFVVQMKVLLLYYWHFIKSMVQEIPIKKLIRKLVKSKPFSWTPCYEKSPAVYVQKHCQFASICFWVLMCVV